MSKSVCVIGAGVAGISAVKSCLEEGLEPTCFESRDNLGGTWYFNNEEKTQTGRVYESLITNVSKEASCFSDFPYPDEFPPYFSHAKFLEYLKSYVSHFELEKHIHFNRKVVDVSHTQVDGRVKWIVTIQSVDPAIDNEEIHSFDNLIICTGINSKPEMPKIRGLFTTFQGDILHSSDYDSPGKWKGKKVLVIGLDNSGADIVVDTSRQSDRSILSSRSGGWIIPRCFENGLPPDLTATTRFQSFVRSFVPSWIGNWIGNKLLNSRVNHDAIGLRSRFESLDPQSSYLVNDELPAKIMSGKVVVRPDVAEFTEDEAVFVDGRKEKVDCVICATGYSTRFPFITDDILPDDRFQWKLFEWIFPFEFRFPETLAVVGMLPPSGGSDVPSFECQTRYVSQVMSGLTKLPSVGYMRENHKMLFRGLPVGKDKSHVFRAMLGFSYQDRLAKRAGTFPYFFTILFRNPILAFKVLFGPFLSYQYRLTGRHQWNGAPDRIINAIPNTLLAIKKG